MREETRNRWREGRVEVMVDGSEGVGKCRG